MHLRSSPDTLDIGEVANSAGVTPATLRFYEHKGLIAPCGRGGLRRRYCKTVLERLALIALGRAAGFSLDELAAMLPLAGKPRIDKARLEAKADELDDLIRKLSAVREGLRHAIGCDAPDFMSCPHFRRVLTAAQRHPPATSPHASSGTATTQETTFTRGSVGRRSPRRRVLREQGPNPRAPAHGAQVTCIRGASALPRLETSAPLGASTHADRPPPSGGIMPKVLGSVVCTPSKAKTGESVCVEVLSPTGKAYDNKEKGTIFINGVPGTKHFLVFHTPGTKNIRVSAGSGKAREKLLTTVDIAARPKNDKPPRLEIGWRPDRPTVASLSILQAPPRARVGSPDQVFRAKAEKAKAKKAGRKLTLKLRRGGGPSKALYTFNFGTGAQLSSARPHVSYDFGPHLDPDRLHRVFHVEAVVEQPGARRQVLRRSVVVSNPYALLKRRGVLSPPVVSADPSAVFTGTLYRARFAVRNPEATAMVLTSRRIQLIFDRETNDTRLLPAEKLKVTLKARATTELKLERRKGSLPREAEAVAVHYTGTGPGRKPVRIVAYFDIPAHVRPNRIVAPSTVKWLADLAKRGLIADPRRVPLGELMELERQGLLDDKPRKAGTKVAFRPSVVIKKLAELKKPAKPLSGHTEAKPAVEGQECDPWNPPSVVPDGMFCMATSETRTVKMPARFMNARKGDIVLSPSNGTLIGDLFRALDPHQPFSHCGIMTRNRDEITHSTAVEDRLTEETFVDSDGIRPDILKYCWPGSITQSVEAAVFGETFVDPETGKEYPIAGFPTLEGESGSGSATEITPAMVVKPDPLVETDSTRKALGEIADIALANVGKSHYRFFCFTDPTIGLSDVAPSSAKWAAGTFPSVCSSYVWMAVRKWLEKNDPNRLIEGAVEQSDLAAGSQIAEGTPDGLYVYDADERLTAGEVLREKLIELVNDALSNFEIFISDLDDDLSNQVLNTFASDWADKAAGQSEKWRNTSDANAISPTNMLSWDAPLYGASEPLVFRDTRFEEVTIHKWKKVKKTGTIKGVVRFDGNPVAGADVQISATQLTHTDGQGKFVIQGAPEGDSVIEAHKVDSNGTFLSGKQTVTVVGNGTTNVVVALSLPSHMFRRLVIDGSQHTIDHEFAAAADPHKFKDFHATVDLGPGSTTHVTKKFNCVADGEVLGQLILTFDLLANDEVKVRTKLRCYDSATENTDDFGEANISAMVCGPGGTVSASIWVEDDNYAEASFTVTNQVANS